MSAPAHAHVDEKIVNPGHLRASATLNGVFGAFVLIGVIAFFVSYASDPTRAWESILRGHFFFMGISILAMFFVAIHWITTSMWSAPVRRIAEGFTAYLPFVFISSILVFCGAKHLYPWTNLEYVKNDPVVLAKSGYLNMTFFVIRTLIAVLGWNLFRNKIVNDSLRLDEGKSIDQVYHTSRKYGIAFVAFFAITFTMMAIDQLMSLDPHYFSTMFGVYNFGGFFQTFFAVLAIVTILLKRSGYLKDVINENHYHDIGKMMFAFTVFWAYTGFSQYMLYWYANLPEETGYLILRFNPSWYWHTIGLFTVKFIIPFGVLLPRTCKRNETVLFSVACWILMSEFLDLNWMIQPQFSVNGPQIGFGEIGVWLGFAGIFGLMVTRFYRKHNVLAFTDPYLPDSAFHHHVQ